MAIQPGRRLDTARQRAAVKLGWVTILAWSLSAVAIGELTLLSILVALQPADNLIAEVIPLVTAGSALAIVGSAIASRRRVNPIGWLLAGSAIGIATAFLAAVLTLQSMNSGVLPMGSGAAFVGWVGWWSLFLGLGLFAAALLVFPNGRLPSRAWRLPAAVSLGLLATAAIAGAFAPRLPVGPGTISNPFGIPGPIGEVLQALQSFVGPIQLLAICLAVAAPVARYRKAAGAERRQLRLLAFSAALVPVGLALAGTVARETTIGFYLMTLPFTLVPVAIGVAVLKYRLYDVDAMMGRTLLYGALTAYVVALYVAVVGGLGIAFQTTGNLLISLVATGLVAVLFQPIRERLQGAVRRLVYGDRDDPYRVLTELGRRLETSLSPDDVLPTIVAITRTALGLRYCAIAISEASGPVVVAEAGDPRLDPHRIALVHQGEPVGDLLLGIDPDRGLSRDDRRLLVDLARQFGVAVHAVRLTEALQRSRERLVTAREEERRRLRRDLHDGLGPRLASLTLRLESARDRNAPDPRTRELLDDLAERCRESVADIRRLIYALRPPALDDLGLVSAIREGLAGTFGGAQGDLELSVQAPPDLPALPAAVEVAAYRIVQEATTNAMRHASARRCRVSLAIDSGGDGLCIEVEDDGNGIATDHPIGVGLASMRERAEELGGSFVIGRGPRGGTRVTARLPCRQGDAPERREEPLEAAEVVVP